MRYGRTDLPRLAMVLGAALAGTTSPSAAAPIRHGMAPGHAGVRYATHDDIGRRARGHHGAGLVALVGDRGGGLGFYPLPAKFRTAEGRGYRGRYEGRGGGIRYAVDNAAGLGYFYGLDDGDFGTRRANPVFNPVDGYGSPFFAGYYGPAHGPDENPGPFGQPYDN